MLNTRISFICQQRYTSLATDSVAIYHTHTRAHADGRTHRNVQVVGGNCLF